MTPLLFHPQQSTGSRVKVMQKFTWPETLPAKRATFEGSPWAGSAVGEIAFFLTFSHSPLAEAACGRANVEPTTPFSLLGTQDDDASQTKDVWRGLLPHGLGKLEQASILLPPSLFHAGGTEGLKQSL